MLKSSQTMAMLWRLGQTNIVKRFYDGVTVLSCRNPSLPNIISRLDSTIQKTPLARMKFRTEQKFRAIDKVSDDFFLIYRSSITNFITWSYYSSYCFIIVSLIGLFTALKNMDDLTSVDMMASSDMTTLSFPPFKAGQNKYSAIYMLGSAMVMNLIVVIFSRLHVTRIWCNRQTNQYVLCLTGGLPGLKKSVVFGPGDAKRKIKIPKFAIGRMAHLVNGKTYYFTESQFRTPMDYHRMIGSIPKV